MRAAILVFGVVVMMGAGVMAQTQKSAPPASTAEKVIIDTDIGDDIDDAFAIALAVRSPELEILGVTTTFGDTEARARIADRLLGEAGRADIPVLAGAATKTSNVMSQQRYGQSGQFAKASHASAVDFILEEIRKYPGQITLVGIGPLMNIEHFHKSCSVFGVKKEALAVGGGNGLQGSVAGLEQFTVRTGSLAAQDLLYLAPHIFDGVEVW